MRASTVSASAVRWRESSQRGLSGMMPARRKSSTAGTATAVNIQRQPYCAFHAAAESVPLKTAGAARADLPVEDLRAKDATDNRELIEADQTAAPLRRADFRDVHGRDVRGKADGEAAHNAPCDECREREGPSGKYGGDGEQRSRKQQ